MHGGQSCDGRRWVPAEKRGRAMSILYGCFNAGSVLSMALTPIFATELGWPSAFRSFAIVGLIWAVRLLASLQQPLGDLSVKVCCVACPGTWRDQVI